jgi:hypothetical protein
MSSYPRQSRAPLITQVKVQSPNPKIQYGMRDPATSERRPAPAARRHATQTRSSRVRTEGTSSGSGYKPGWGLIIPHDAVPGVEIVAKAKTAPKAKPPPKAKANFAVPKTKAVAKPKAKPATKAKAQTPVHHVCPQCDATWIIDGMDRGFHVTAEVWNRFGCTVCGPADGESSNYDYDNQGFSLSDADYRSSEDELSCPVVEEGWDEWEDNVE